MGGVDDSYDEFVALSLYLEGDGREEELSQRSCSARALADVASSFSQPPGRTRVVERQDDEYYLDASIASPLLMHAITFSERAAKGTARGSESRDRARPPVRHSACLCSLKLYFVRQPPLNPFLLCASW